MNFNPRSYKRSDMLEMVICIGFLRFQSTLLQEERHSQMYFLYSGMNFNPRSYKRSDSFSNSFSMLLFISIHAPTRGATRLPVLCAVFQIYFNPRSYKRSDHFLAFSHRIVVNFNPRSYKRSDGWACILAITVLNFNPRSYKRSDCYA